MQSNKMRTAVGLAFTLGLGWSGVAEAKWSFPTNHPDLDWYTIETEHFAVHYPVSKKSKEEGNEHELTGEWSARWVAEVSEDMWQPMCAEFNYYLKERVHIVLLNQGDSLAGFTVPNWDWIEISANPGGTFYRSRGRMEWISDVMVHEFAHVVSLKANAAHSEGTFGVSFDALYSDGINDTDVGASMFLSDGDSVFWTEGGAEYWSDNTGWNWWTPSRDQNIRMTVLDDRLLKYKEWHTRSNKRLGWNDSERYYQQGYSFGQYLRQRFGHETYARFAIEYGKAWRPQWESVIEDVTGVDAETLYNDWKEYLTERYEGQRERIRARGEVAGKEWLGRSNEWEFSSPQERDDWFEEHPRQYWRDREKEATGTYQWEPRISPDGKYMAKLNRARIYVSRQEDDQVREWTGVTPTDPERSEASALKSTTFPADFEHGFDFVPGKDQLVLTGREDMMNKPFSAATNIRFEADGYDWKKLYLFDFTEREKKHGNRTITTRERKRFLGKGAEFFPKDSFRQIPNTERGQDPAVSPDGERVAFFEYTDGNLNLVTIKLDGSDKKYLTNYADGTWMQTVDWSPDGKQLVFALFRNFRQDLYTVNADGSDLKPITWDQWEEHDAHWNADGKIYFSADPDGVFNVFSYDPETEEFTQLTNVVSGAVGPQISPQGNLLYNHYTAFGWKMYALPGDQFFNQPASHLFNTVADEEAVEHHVTYTQDLTHWADTTRKYRWYRSLAAPMFIPVFRANASTGEATNVQLGGQMLIMDVVEKHQMISDFLLGEDTFLIGRYYWQGWYPTFGIVGYHWQGKYDSGYRLDDDDDPTTTDDQYVMENKGSQTYDAAFAFINYPWNDTVFTAISGQAQTFAVRGADDAGFVRYLNNAELGLFWQFSNNSYFYSSPNPTFGRTVELGLYHGWTDVVYPVINGVATDDGQLLDNYEYNRGEFHWTEQVKMPTFWGVPFLQEARARNHMFTFDVHMAGVDRNVDSNDEFRAGGMHPSRFSYNSLQANSQFAGYPYYSLSGETLGILNLAYRMPLYVGEGFKVGPLYTYGWTLQFAGTAGNLWSYRPPEDESLVYRSRYGERIAYNEADIRREIPFVDYAYKNSPIGKENYLLYDASVELRVQSVLFHGSSWDSFLRLAYGFNEIRGYGDVDGDNVFDTSDNALDDELSNETEKQGLRVYLGLGTGW